MSEVFSFRLSRGNPRENQAYEILTTRQAQEFSLRAILVDALISAENDRQTGPSTTDLDQTLKQIQKLLMNMQDRQAGPKNETPPEEENPPVSDIFILSIKKGVKNGIRDV
jgi:hypothetical protein